MGPGNERGNGNYRDPFYAHCWGVVWLPLHCLCGCGPRPTTYTAVTLQSWAESARLLAQACADPSGPGPSGPLR